MCQHLSKLVLYHVSWRAGKYVGQGRLSAPFSLFSSQNFNFARQAERGNRYDGKEKKKWVTRDWTYDPVRVVRKPRHRSRSKGTRGVHGSTRVGYSESANVRGVRHQKRDLVPGILNRPHSQVAREERQAHADLFCQGVWTISFWLRAYWDLFREA